MYRLYIGNLNESVDESSIQDLFAFHDLEVGDILIKNGFAFCDVADQAAVDMAIEMLNGKLWAGSLLQVEPSMSHRRRSNKVQLRDIPHETTSDLVHKTASKYGTVQHVDMISDGQGSSGATYQVTFETPEEANNAVQGFNNPATTSLGPNAKAEFVNSRSNRTRRGGPFGTAGLTGLGQTPRVPTGAVSGSEFPLRILVAGEMVGAIIGKGGQTIRQITQTSRARVDVHGRDSVGLSEKAITIYGVPEACSMACKEILQVIDTEDENRDPTKPVVLKLLAHNNLCGRLIGSGGAVIRKIMEDSDTKVTVSRQELFTNIGSSGHDVASYNFDRVITIRGDNLDNVMKAESGISAKLRQCFDVDAQALTAGTGTPPSAANALMFSGARVAVTSGGATGQFSMFPGLAPPRRTYGNASNNEVVRLYIPNLAVGAIIGTRGSNIRNIIRMSGASIKVAPLVTSSEGTVEASSFVTNPANPGATNTKDRLVTITGSAEAQWKAQYYIFDKIKTEGFSGHDEARLQAEISMPKALIGRIIGRGGTNVREIQRITGAIIKLPSGGPTPTDKTPAEGDGADEDVKVQIVATFFASQSAQRRIRALCGVESTSGTRTRLSNGVPGTAPHTGSGESPPPQTHRRRYEAKRHVVLPQDAAAQQVGLAN